MAEAEIHVVTGGAGFIGSAFVAKLNQQGISRIIVVDELGCSDKWKNLRGKFFLDYLHKDQFRQLLGAGKFANQIRSIVHMGACSTTTETDVEYLMQNNFRYSCELADYATKHNIRFIYASSAATYGDGALGYSDSDETTRKLMPLNPYGFSKQAFDLWALSTGAIQKMVGLKFFNVFGPNEYHKGSQQSLVPQAFKQIRETGVVRLFKSNTPKFKDGEQLRDFIYVKDCLEVMWNLLQNPGICGVFNLGTGQARSFKDLVGAVFAALGKTPNISYIEMPESLSRQYQNYTQAEMSKLRSALPDLRFSRLEDAVRDYVQSYLNVDCQCL